MVASAKPPAPQLALQLGHPAGTGEAKDRKALSEPGPSAPSWHRSQQRPACGAAVFRCGQGGEHDRWRGLGLRLGLDQAPWASCSHLPRLRLQRRLHGQAIFLNDLFHGGHWLRAAGQGLHTMASCLPCPGSRGAPCVSRMCGQPPRPWHSNWHVSSLKEWP